MRLPHALRVSQMTRVLFGLRLSEEQSVHSVRWEGGGMNLLTRLSVTGSNDLHGACEKPCTDPPAISIPFAGGVYAIDTFPRGTIFSVLCPL